MTSETGNTMEPVGVIAVVGACRPERLRYARRLAAETNRMLIPAVRLVGSPDPAREAAVLSSWADPSVGAVVELPEQVSATELIGTFADEAERALLGGLVCVVDASHIVDDLHRDDYLTIRDIDSGLATPFVARAHLTVVQIEYASTIVLVNWTTLASRELATVMALLSSLSPGARLRLHRDDIALDEPVSRYSAEQERAGWVRLLNGAFDPHMTDRRVVALRYEQLRPLHPGRLRRLLDDRVEAGEFGRVVRSAGFCRFATRPGIVAQWDHVGRVISFTPVAVDDPVGEDEETLALGQDLAIIGLDLDEEGLTEALDEASLTDEEFAAGPAAWRSSPDPFPRWTTATDRSE